MSYSRWWKDEAVAPHCRVRAPRAARRVAGSARAGHHGFLTRRCSAASPGAAGLFGCLEAGSSGPGPGLPPGGRDRSRRTRRDRPRPDAHGHPCARATRRREAGGASGAASSRSRSREGQSRQFFDRVAARAGRSAPAAGEHGAPLGPTASMIAVLSLAAAAAAASGALQAAETAFAEGDYPRADALATAAAEPPQEGAALYLAGLARF